MKPKPLQVEEKTVANAHYENLVIAVAGNNKNGKGRGK